MTFTHLAYHAHRSGDPATLARLQKLATETLARRPEVLAAIARAEAVIGKNGLGGRG